MVLYVKGLRMTPLLGETICFNSGSFKIKEPPHQGLFWRVIQPLHRGERWKKGSGSSPFFDLSLIDKSF